jgi:hypothetical protein
LAEAFGVRSGWHGPGNIDPINHAAQGHVDLTIPNFGIQEDVDLGWGKAIPIRALLKLSSGPQALEHTNVESILAQAGRDSSGFQAIGEMLGTHPYLTNRIRELIAFNLGSHEVNESARRHACAHACDLQRLVN